MDPFPPGTLWQKVQQATTTALQHGGLQPIPTQFETLSEAGITFLVRIIDHLARKPQPQPARGPAATGANPFLPYDPQMYVADASATHVCLLNKFNVLDHHLLIVTRKFEDQQQRLNLADFTALWRCMAEYPSLGFYNAGAVAGASQPHKHLQTVPLPLAATGSSTPIDPLIDTLPADPPLHRLAALPFRHAIAHLDPAMRDEPARAAERTLRLYDRLLEQLDLTSTSATGTPHIGPYNLLITRRWLMLVPRVFEAFHGISINALGFAGALLVKDRQQYEVVKRHGPLAALRHVAHPATAAGRPGPPASA